MRQSLLLAFTLAFAGGFAVGVVSCSDDESNLKAKGAACKTTPECQKGLVCLPGVNKCDVPPPPPICAKTGAAGCTNATQCGGGFTCSFNCCEKICASNADCGVKEQCDTGICVKEACSANIDCGDATQVCDTGSCVAAPTAASATSCKILPDSGFVAHTGSTRQFTAIAYAGTKILVAPANYFTFLSDNGAVTVDSTGLATITGSTSGTATISAKVGTLPCLNTAPLQFFGPLASNTMRVVVVDSRGQPISGATIAAANGNVLGVTTADGSTTFALAGPQAETVTIAHDNYAWVTVYQTTERDLIVSLAGKSASKLGWKGTVSKPDFLRLAEEGGELNFGLFGSSIPGNALDINLDTIVGDLVPTAIEGLGANPITAPLPSGAVIGLGFNFFKGSGLTKTGATDPRKGFWFFGEPGDRAAWGIGGNVKISNLDPLLQVIGNDNIDVGKILNGVLPLLSKLQSGVVGVAPGAGEITNTDTLAGLSDIKVDLTERLRLKQYIGIPALPDADTDGRLAEGVIVLAGVNAPGRGIVPLGLSAALDVAATEAPDGHVTFDDKELDVSLTDKIGIRLAYAHGGIEGGKYVDLALALSLSGASVTGGASSGSVKISGLIKQSASVPFNLATPPEVIFDNGSFLEIGHGTTRNVRTVTFGNIDTKTDVVRFDLRTDSGDDWYIYVDRAVAVAAPLIVPQAPSGFAVDRYAAAEPQFFVQQIALGNRPLTTTPYNAADVYKFDDAGAALNMDNLNDALQAFSTYELP